MSTQKVMSPIMFLVDEYRLALHFMDEALC